MPFGEFSAAGVAAIQGGVVDINGIPWSTTGVPVAAAVTPLFRLPFAKRFGGVAPNPVRATAKGDNNRNRHEYIFNPDQMGETAIMQHALNLDQYAGYLKIKKVTDGNGYAVGIQTNAPVNAAQGVFVVNVDAQQAGLTGVFGLKKFINEIYPLVTMVPLLANLQELAPADWSFFGVPTQASQLPWGTPFSIATHGFTRSGGYLLTSDFPIVCETFKAVGAEVSATLTYTPATPAATYLVAYKFAAGVWSAFTVTSVTGKVANFAALSADDIIFFRYESQDFLQVA